MMMNFASTDQTVGLDKSNWTCLDALVEGAAGDIYNLCNTGGLKAS
jgi:hypothetical protein